MPQSGPVSLRLDNVKWRTIPQKSSKSIGRMCRAGATYVCSQRRASMKERVYEQLTLFPEASRASRSVWLESRKEKGTTVISGLRCDGLSPSLSHVGWWVKTYLESCELLLPTSSRIWKGWAFTSSCWILKQRVSVPRTTGSELRLWPTVTQRDYKGANSMEHMRKPNKHQRQLPNAVKLYAAPQARDFRSGQSERWEDPKRSRNLNDQCGGQLNPTWVEWLMGFPIGAAIADWERKSCWKPSKTRKRAGLGQENGKHKPKSL